MINPRSPKEVLTMDSENITPTNTLKDENSPYLLQHQFDPVDWMPWGEEAFQKAKEEKKMVFLSIGYSTCHWCHVMQHESFQDVEIAAKLNSHYVSIKVDREERPDLDVYYQRAAQLLGRGGGWPLSIFMTADREVVYAGTYFPPKPRYGVPDFTHVLLEVFKAVQDNADQISEGAQRLEKIIQGSFQTTEQIQDEFSRREIEEAAEMILMDGDMVNGGFGNQPKFPSSSVLSFLIRLYARTRRRAIGEFLDLTLQKMAHGGIYDQLGGGFHRYSVDRYWNVPHFEKMAYDNAQLAIVYLSMYQLTQNDLYRRIGREILEYMLQRLSGEDGVLYSAEDADSDGKEGKFYLWSGHSLKKALVTETERKFAETYFGIDTQISDNTLRVALPLSSVKKKLGLSNVDVETFFSGIRKKMLSYRDTQRTRPFRDEKTQVNIASLMISAFIYGYRVLGEERYLTAARKAHDFIIQNMWDEETRILLHSYVNGKTRSSGFLDDYAFLLQATIDLHNQEPLDRYYELIEQLVSSILKYFWNEELSTFIFVSKFEESPIENMIIDNDEPIPSGIAIAIKSLILASSLLGRHDELPQISEKVLQVHFDSAVQHPGFHGALLEAVDAFVHKPVEISFSEIETKELLAMKDYVKTSYIQPHVIIPILNQDLQEFGRAFALVCNNYICSKPLETLSEFQERMSQVLQGKILE